MEPPSDPPSRESWSVPRPENVPRPTTWPAGLALATTLFLWGLCVSEVIAIAGFVFFWISLAGWIGEMRHGER